MNHDFWESPLGNVTGKQEDAFAKNFSTIPNNTKALAAIHGFVDKQYNGINYYEIDWLLKDGPFAGRHVFQKLQVHHQDTNKRHRALNILKLLFNMFNMPVSKAAPAQHELNKFVSKVAGIIIQETTPNEQGKVYNWVSEIYPAQGHKTQSSEKPPVVSGYRMNHSAPPVIEANDYGDDIPF